MKTNQQIREEILKEIDVADFHKELPTEYFKDLTLAIDLALLKKAEDGCLHEWLCPIDKTVMEHQKEIHTFVCPKCQYREWYPQRIGDGYCKQHDKIRSFCVDCIRHEIVAQREFVKERIEKLKKEITERWKGSYPDTVIRLIDKALEGLEEKK